MSSSRPVPVAGPTSGTRPPAPPVPLPERIPPSHSVAGHVRATVIFLALTILVAGFLYPAVTVGIAEIVNPYGASGSLLKDPNGTIVGSELIAQNTSAPYLFWERPSLTDYNTTLGFDTPPGPTDPALQALLNETISYMRQYGNFSVNATLPFWLVSPSASDIDPDLTPEAVLVQVPRVAEANNLPVGNVTALVNAHIVQPVLPYIGVAYVNVLELDLALVAITGR